MEIGKKQHLTALPPYEIQKGGKIKSLGVSQCKQR
jgi:hypothetical protein